MKGKLIKREYVYKAQTEDEVSFVADTFLLPSGEEREYYFVDSPYHVVAVIAIDSNLNVAIIRQYRYIVDEVVTEVPTGSPGENETPLEGARRELAEEAGVEAKEFKKLGTFYTSAGISNQRATIFLATHLTMVGQKLDEMEEIEVEWVPLSRAIELVKSGAVSSQVSALAILLAALHVQV
jgi:8-oxo-dGTP pyrophosphatase MutT (NUDIX family)